MTREDARSRRLLLAAVWPVLAVALATAYAGVDSILYDLRTSDPGWDGFDAAVGAAVLVLLTGPLVVLAVACRRAGRRGHPAAWALPLTGGLVLCAVGWWALGAGVLVLPWVLLGGGVVTALLGAAALVTSQRRHVA